MKRFLLPAIFFAGLLLAEMEANAQRGRVYRRYPVPRPGPMVSVGIGTVWGGFYGGPRVYGYGWGPRVGISVMVPPPGTVSGSSGKVEIDGITYYRRGDIYYRERKQGGLEPVEAPIGAELNRLPMGAKLQKIEGKYYYESKGTLYYKTEDGDGRPVYVIVGKNGELTEKESYNNSGEDYEVSEENDTMVNKGNEGNEFSPEGKEVYTVRPQVGDRFEQLPRDSKQVTVNGRKLFVSPNNIYYKEITEEGETMYEVADVK